MIKLDRLTDEEIREQTNAPVVLSGHRRLADKIVKDCEKQAKEELTKQYKIWEEATLKKAEKLIKKQAEIQCLEEIAWIEKYVFYVDARGYIALRPNASSNWQALKDKLEAQ